MNTTIETIGLLLEGALEETDDPEVNYKLRAALQLLVVVEEDRAGVHEVLEYADIGDETRRELRELGYIE